MFASLEAFLNELHLLKDEFFPNARLEIMYSRINKVSLRLLIDIAVFVDIYFNVESSRFDFTLIKGGRRLFGYDNLKSWHYHPVENPDSHVNCDQPALRLIVKETARVVNSLNAAE